MSRNRGGRSRRSQSGRIPADVDAATERAAEADIPDADLEDIDSSEPRPRTLEYFAVQLTNEPDVDNIDLYITEACEIRQKIRTALSECRASNDEEGIAHYEREEGHLLRKVLVVDALEINGRRSHDVLEYLTDRVNSGINLEPLEMEFFAELHANTVVDGEWEASRHELIMQQKHGRTGGILGWRTGMHTLRKFMAGDYRATTVTDADGYTHTNGQGTEAASKIIGKNKWLIKTSLGAIGLLFGGPAGWTIGAGMLARGAVEAVKRAGFTERKDRETGFSLNEAVTEGEIAIAGLVKALSEEVMHAEDPEAKNRAIEALVEAELCASGNNFELHIYRVGNQTVMRASLPGKPPVIAPPSNSEEVFSQITLETTDYTDGTKRKVKTRGVATFDGVLGRSIKTERVFGAVETLASLAAGGIAGSQAVLRGMHEAVQQGHAAGKLAQSADFAHPSFRAMESVGDVKGLARSLLSAKEWLLNIQHDPAGMADFHRVAENADAFSGWDFIHAAHESVQGAEGLDAGSAVVASQTIDSIGAFLNSMKALVALSGVQMLNRAGIDAPHDALKSEFEEIDELYRRVKAQSERIKVPPAKPNGSSGNSSASSPSAPKSGEGGSDSGGGGSESGPHVMTEREKKIRAKIAEEARLDVEQLPKVGEENWFALNANGSPDFTKQCHITNIVWGPTADTATILFEETKVDANGTNYTEGVRITLAEFLTYYKKANKVPKTFEENNPAARPAAKPAEAAAPVPPAAPAPHEARPAAEPKPANAERPPRPNLAESDDGGLESNGHKEKYDTDEEATTEIQKLNRLLRDEREVDSNCQMPTLKLFVKVNGRNAIFTPKYDFNGMLYNIDMTKPDQNVVTANNGTERQVKLDHFIVKTHGNEPGYYIYARVSLVKGVLSTNEQGAGQEDNTGPINEDEENRDDEGTW